MPGAEFLLCFIVVLASALLQGVSGFGFSLLALPIISLVMPVQHAVAMFMLFSFVLNIMVLSSAWKGLHLRRIWPLIAAGIIGVPIGTYLLVSVDGNVLQIAIGAVVIIASMCLLSGYRVHLRDERHAMVPVGLLSGILSGSITFGGPPVIIFLANQQVDKSTFRANITAYFLALNIVGIPSYAARDLITREVLHNSVLLSPALLGGTLLGIYLSHRVEEQKFRRLTLMLIAALGLLCLGKGISGLEIFQ